jgi:hypothetical protein
LKPDILGDDDALTAALTEPRAREYASQMSGYRIISDLVSSPKSTCWGSVFRYLFPLSREVCNGCPADPDGRITNDEVYKLRTNPNISLPATRPVRRLGRNMGSFNEMIVVRSTHGPCTLAEMGEIAVRAAQNDIGVLVVPNRFANQIVYNGMLLDYDEFQYAVGHCDYFFAKGVLCVYEGDATTNLKLYKTLGKLESLGYRRVHYCNENIVVSSGSKRIKEYCEGYSIPIEKF